MAYQASNLMTSRRSHGWKIDARFDLSAALVSLGVGALGTATLAVVSASVVYTHGTLAVYDQDALVMAGVVGLVVMLLTALFTRGAFRLGHPEPTPPMVYLESLRLSTRQSPVVHAHFRFTETEQLKQIARSRAANQ